MCYIKQNRFYINYLTISFSKFERYLNLLTVYKFVILFVLYNINISLFFFVDIILNMY